jgi:dTDP-glucose 4,6-dehydratase
MATLVITGGAGFIGSNLVQYVLSRTSDSVVVVDKMTYAANPKTAEALRASPRVTFVIGDIADRDAMEQVFRSHQPSAIMDVARRYLAGLDAQARSMFRFLHVSTDEVFGSLGDEGRFSEQTPYAPNSPYSASKAAADHLVRAYHHTYALPTLVTNCSNNYGPYQHPEKLIPLTMLNALEGRRLPIYGDGGNIRDWLHVEDHCAAIDAVLRRGTPGASYNVGADNEQTNLAIVALICDVLEELVPAAGNPHLAAAGKRSYRELPEFVADRPGHDRRYAIDAGRITRELGWRPAKAFRQGLLETARWYLDHQDWYDASRLGYDRERLGLSALPQSRA